MRPYLVIATPAAARRCLWLAWLCALTLLHACASAKRKASPSAAPSAQASDFDFAQMSDGDKRAEIERLAGLIADSRMAQGLPGEPTLAPHPTQAPSQDPLAPMATAAKPINACAQAASDPSDGLIPLVPRCESTCQSGASICDNAARICRLADLLAPDAWAAQKCAQAQASCQEGRQRCCACLG